MPGQAYPCLLICRLLTRGETRVEQFRKAESRKWLKIITFVFTFFLLLLVSGYLLLPWGAPGIIIWMFLVLAGLFMLVRWHTKSFAYRCLKCGDVFTVSAIKDYFSHQGISRDGGKVMTCPCCRQTSVMQVIIKREKNKI